MYLCMPNLLFCTKKQENNKIHKRILPFSEWLITIPRLGQLSFWSQSHPPRAWLHNSCFPYQIAMLNEHHYCRWSSFFDKIMRRRSHVDNLWFVNLGRQGRLLSERNKYIFRSNLNVLEQFVETLVEQQTLLETKAWLFNNKASLKLIHTTSIYNISVNAYQTIKSARQLLAMIFLLKIKIV